MARHTLTTGLLALGFVAFSGALTWHGLNAAPAVDRPAVELDAAAVERGAYLVKTMGCHDCHTPWTMGPRGPEPDMSRALTGHPADFVMPPPPPLPPGPWLWLGAATNTAFAGPWGVSFTANLTPDKETGLGNWTAETFIAMLKTGRHEGKGRAVLPPMPVQVYAELTEEDMRAVFAYLQSLAPVHNRVPQPIDPPEAGQ
ncbi:MAG: c-type cytochrome [Vicinamibacterales bacterium]|nr:c-type cytochrome [Vicinamibacterales bacterium]